MNIEDLGVGPPAETLAPGPAPSPEQAQLRPAEDPAVSCVSCANFMPDQTCAVLGVPVEPQLVCDLFTPAEAAASPDLMSTLFGGAGA